LPHGAASVRRCDCGGDLPMSSTINCGGSVPQPGTTCINHINSLMAILAPSPTLCPTTSRRIGLQMPGARPRPRHHDRSGALSRCHGRDLAGDEEGAARRSARILAKVQPAFSRHYGCRSANACLPRFCECCGHLPSRMRAREEPLPFSPSAFPRGRERVGAWFASWFALWFARSF
jgi:hypothetical protein